MIDAIRILPPNGFMTLILASEAWSMALAFARGVITRGSGRSSQRKVLVDHSAHAVAKAGAVWNCQALFNGLVRGGYGLVRGEEITVARLTQLAPSLKNVGGAL